MADHCQRSTTRELRDFLGSLLDRSAEQRDPSWGQTWKQLERCSEGFGNELDHALTRRFPPPTPWQDFLGTLIPQPPHGYWAEHVPQEIPMDWIKESFPSLTHLPVASVYALRRTAALQLVQGANGSSPREAARFLGVPAAWMVHGGRVMSPEAMVRATSEFDLMDALQNLAQHLADLPEQIDYRERRRRFATWHLSHDQWEALLAAARTDAQSCGPGVNRNVTSAYVWAQVTGSEWTLAPIMRVPAAAEESWSSRSGPAAVGMRRLAGGLNGQVVRLAEAADAVARALSQPEQATRNRRGRSVQSAPATAPSRTR